MGTQACDLEQGGPQGKSCSDDMVTIVSGPDSKSTTNARVLLGEEREKMGMGAQASPPLWGQVSEEILVPGADRQLPPRAQSQGQAAASVALPVPAQ